ncbi:MAG: hypothetical protein JXQ27_10945, partial [Acidobacteria bacterium]|nr:hypothetical protein [Acidobacteriota bacterium]
MRISATLFLILTLALAGWGALPGETPALRSGGVIAGFDAGGRPVPPTTDLHEKRLPATPTGGERFVCAETVRPEFRDYILELLYQVEPHIPTFYGPAPDPDLTITVHDDGSGSGWFYYNTAAHRIIISAYPSLYVHRDDDGDGRVDEDPFDGRDNDGDGRVDEDYDNDPVFDAMLVHELVHSWHDNLWMFASWAEEGMTECATELLAHYLHAHGVRDIRDISPERVAGKTPSINLLYFDMLEELGPAVLGGTLYAGHKALPSLFYRSAAALFLVLCSSQADTVTDDLAAYTLLRDLNAALQTVEGGVITGDVFYQALDDVCDYSVDGLWPVSRWVQGRSVTATTSRPGAQLGIYTAYGDSPDGLVFTVANPSYFNVFAFERVVAEADPWQTREEVIVADGPVNVEITTAEGHLVWRSAPEEPVTLAAATGLNWHHFADTERWPAGWYRIAATVELPGHGRLRAENVFLVLGPEYGAAEPLDEADEGLAVLVRGTGETVPVVRPACGEDTEAAWQGAWSMVVRPTAAATDAFVVRLALGRETPQLNLPRPWTRIVPLHHIAYLVADVAGAEAGYTGLSLVNPGPDIADLGLDWYAEDGQLVECEVNPAARSLVGGEQVLNLVPDLFAAAPRAGWVQVTATHPIGAFSLSGDAAGLALDGTLALEDVARQLVFPALRVEDDNVTRLTVVNPFEQETMVWFQLLDNLGYFRTASIWHTLPAKGQLRQDVANLFPDIALTDEMYVIAAATQPVAGVASFTNSESVAALPAVRLAAVMPFEQPELAAGAVELVSAQFALGGGFRTWVQLVNTDLFLPLDMQAQILGPDGEPLAADMLLEFQPGEKKVLDVGELFGIDDTSGLRDGWLRFRCSHGLADGAVFFGDETGRFLSAQALIRRTHRRLLFGHVCQGNQGGLDYFTGIALLNPSADIPAAVFLTLRNAGGE